MIIFVKFERKTCQYRLYQNSPKQEIVKHQNFRSVLLNFDVDWISIDYIQTNDLKLSYFWVKWIICYISANYVFITKFIHGNQRNLVFFNLKNFFII